MIFLEDGDETLNFQERYTDRPAALAGHKGAMAYLKAGRLHRDSEDAAASPAPTPETHTVQNDFTS